MSAFVFVAVAGYDLCVYVYHTLKECACGAPSPLSMSSFSKAPACAANGNTRTIRQVWSTEDQCTLQNMASAYNGHVYATIAVDNICARQTALLALLEVSSSAVVHINSDLNCATVSCSYNNLERLAYIAPNWLLRIVPDAVVYQSI